MTSGTSQMTTNLLMYYMDSIDLKLIPVQVATYTGQSNQTKENNKTVDKAYDIEAEAICNLDNEEKTRTCRIEKPDLRKYSRILTKNQIEKLSILYTNFTKLLAEFGQQKNALFINNLVFVMIFIGHWEIAITA